VEARADRWFHVPVLGDLWTATAAILSIAVALLASGHAVLHKRDVRAALGWVGFIWLAPVVGAVAIRGDGVVETLYALLQRCFRSIDKQFGLEAKWQISEREFLDKIFAHVDMRGFNPREAQPR